MRGPGTWRSGGSLTEPHAEPGAGGARVRTNVLSQHTGATKTRTRDSVVTSLLGPLRGAVCMRAVLGRGALASTEARA